MKKYFRYILVGALALIPLLIVVQLLFWINQLALNLFVFVSSYTDSSAFTIILFAFTFIILAIVGSSMEKFGKSVVVSMIDKALIKVPAIGTVYSIIKKITALFTPNQKDEKKDVILVEYPKVGLWVPAYVLNEYKNLLVIFVPTSPNPTSGYTVIVEKSKVKSTSLSVAEASQFIISMGADFIKKDEITKIINDSHQQKR
jgi:uncharacterized membrane protein